MQRAVFETLYTQAPLTTEEPQVRATPTAWKPLPVRCAAIGNLLYELLALRDTSGQLNLAGGAQRSPWASKALTLRRLPGQN